MTIPPDLLEGSAAEVLAGRLRAATTNIAAPTAIEKAHEGVFVGFADDGLKCLWACAVGLRSDHRALLAELARIERDLLQTEAKSNLGDIQAYVGNLRFALGRARDLAELANHFFEVEAAAQFPELYDYDDPLLYVDADWTIYAFEDEEGPEEEDEERLVAAILGEEQEPDEPTQLPQDRWLQ